MAKHLRDEAVSGNLSRGTFLEFVEKHEAIEDEIADAQETMRSIRQRRKDLRKTIEESGILLAEFDRHLVDEKRSGEEREAAEHTYRQYMAWRGKPVGFQGKLDLTAESPEDAIAFEQREVKRADRDGFKAGKTGDRSDSNPWRPGSEPFAAWHSAWLLGQAEKVTDEIQPSGPKRRGRPPKNAATGNGAAVGAVTPEHAVARAQGMEDGLAGHIDHAARWGEGEYGHGDYWLGHADGQREREAAFARDA